MNLKCSYILLICAWMIFHEAFGQSILNKSAFESRAIGGLAKSKPVVISPVDQNEYSNILSSGRSSISRPDNEVSLAGKWRFRIDSLNIGEKNGWYNAVLDDQIELPGSMSTNGKGNDISVNTPWTGGIVDSAFFTAPEYAKYRRAGNVKVPFWFQPLKYYSGASWYQKDLIIPKSWTGGRKFLFLERCHWKTTVWVNGEKLGSQNSLGTAHVYDLTKFKSGKHVLTIRVDNRVRDLDVGINSHSISDHTQGNWNGIVGEIKMIARPGAGIDLVSVYPDVKRKEVKVVTRLFGDFQQVKAGTLKIWAEPIDKKAPKPEILEKKVWIEDAVNPEVTLVYPMGEQPLLWDEFNPNLYRLKVEFSAGKQHRSDTKDLVFGMREITVEGKRMLVNGRPIFLRGTLECAVFPATGYPPMDEKEWEKIFEVCRSYGLNHLRFHSWCPPVAAFNVADRMGFYLQIECGSWASTSTTLGDGKGVDQFIYEESKRIVEAYGNHPSFCMMTYGNEPAGKNYTKYLADFTNYWKQADRRRLYTSAAGWPVIEESDFHNVPQPRIQVWGAIKENKINKFPPANDYTWSSITDKYNRPAVTHEIGQWCAYPDFKEIDQYTGVLRPKNYELFKDRLDENGLGKLANDFLMASGKLQVLCYKADIEAVLRTRGMAGYQLLGLTDFPGQGTAPVGILNALWENKGYVTSDEFRNYVNETVPLAHFPKMIYLNSEVLRLPAYLFHYGRTNLSGEKPVWEIRNKNGAVYFNGLLPAMSGEGGTEIRLGDIAQALSSIKQAEMLTLVLKVANFTNSWDFFVYPSSTPVVKPGSLVFDRPDKEMFDALEKGGNVLLTLKQGTLHPDAGGDLHTAFSSIFWNTTWTNKKPMTSLGILCDPGHPALKEYPTQFHSNWQWWDAMTYSNVVMIDKLNKEIEPIVRVIDDWTTARSLGLVFECRVGKGKLLISSIDLSSDLEKRPEARQLLYSLRRYIGSEAFNPRVSVSEEKIAGLVRQ